MAHIGHPLVSDPLYASGYRDQVPPPAARAANRRTDLGRQALHAAELGFEHPATGEEMMAWNSAVAARPGGA